MGKKVFEEPVVTKVEIDFSDRVIAAGCAFLDRSSCFNPEDGSRPANS